LKYKYATAKCKFYYTLPAYVSILGEAVGTIAPIYCLAIYLIIFVLFYIAKIFTRGGF